MLTEDETFEFNLKGQKEINQARKGKDRVVKGVGEQLG